jgi:hypothetical protein
LLEAAKQAKDQNSRAGLVRLAARFLELAGRPRIDFDALLADYNAQQMMPMPSSESASQQQQRIQPKNDKKDRPPPTAPSSAASHQDRSPTYGYEATREAAMPAFAKSWRRQ